LPEEHGFWFDEHQVILDGSSPVQNDEKQLVKEILAKS